MLDLIQKYKGSVIVNGVEYKSILDATNAMIAAGFKGDVNVKLVGVEEVQKLQPKITTNMQEVPSGDVYIITVKKYMTQPGTPDFDFQDKWNKGIPMPLRIMVGTIIKETKGMYYMSLHGEILQAQTSHCMKCGRVLTNPISQYFGIGPECGSHGYVNPFNTETELKEAVAHYNEHLQKTTAWEGWVVKSAITEMVKR